MRDASDHGLDPTTWAVLRALRGGARISRNKHFALFEDPKVRRALKIHRYLRSVVRDIERFPDAVQVKAVGHPEGDNFTLRIEIPSLRGRRTAYLSSTELHLLAQDAPEVAQLLERLLTDETGEAEP
ncbi:MAG: hypothetical protein ACE366_10160 [Bradymonadia bacterium]